MTADDAAPKPLIDQVLAVVVATEAGCSLSHVQEALEHVDPKEVRAALGTLRHAKLLIAGMNEGEPFYKTPAQIPQTQPGTALRRVRGTDSKGSDGEAKSREGAITGEAGESPAAPRRPARAPLKTVQPTTERETPMPAKGKHDTESHRGAIRKAVLKALAASNGDKHAARDLQNFMSPKRRLSARQMGNALTNLKAEGFAATTGRARATVWHATAKGIAEAAKPDADAGGSEAAAAPRPKAKGKRGAPRKAKRKVAPPRRARQAREAAAPIAANDEGATTASFTATGEIIITSPAGTKKLTPVESREVAMLVLAFDSAGLLAKKAA